MLFRVSAKTRRPKVVSARIKADQQLGRDVGAALIASINRNVFQQKQGSGAPLKRNKSSTLVQKQRKGRGSKSLIDEQHRLLKPSTFKAELRDNEIAVTARSSAFGRVLQILKRKGYRGWNRPDKRGMRAIKAALVKWIKREIFRATGKKVGRR